MCCKNKNIIPEYVLNNWKLLNPEYKIFIYDDLECIDFFKKYFDIKFLETFIYIKDGPIKSDFWRLCILYYYGGIYSDIDIEPIKPLDVILHKNISFLIVKRNNAYMFNPHFIASVKNNLILKEIIDKYILYYEKQITYSYWKWSILTMSQRILNKYIGYSVQEGFYKYNHGHCKIITENIGLINLIFNRYKAYNSYNNVRLFNTRYLTYHEFSHTY
jgi:mannosyltransferase OCH1-like enzyme